MNLAEPPSWQAQNKLDLQRALERLRRLLQDYLAGSQGTLPEPAVDSTQDSPQRSGESALESLCQSFSLSEFECNLILLCAGVELDSGIADLCAQAQGVARRTYPTFSLALAVLPGAHWSALSPEAPLRRWKLLEILDTGDLLTFSSLRITERVLHFLTGVSYLDERLQGLVARVPLLAALPPSQQAAADRLVAAWSGDASAADLPIVQLLGRDPLSAEALAAAACTQLGLQLFSLSVENLPQAPAEREALLRLWEREAALTGGALLLKGYELSGSDSHRAAAGFAERLHSPLILGSYEPIVLNTRQTLRVDVPQPLAVEQSDMWRLALGPLAEQLDGQVDRLVMQFNLTTAGIRAASAAALAGDSHSPAELSIRLWNACRVQARRQLDDLAQRIEPLATWDDLVLPEAQTRVLHGIVTHVRNRNKVYEDWGFARRSNRGLGISALFAGASGTGKTMAAEVLAQELMLDLYRIDLSSVVSKYIGETEKNLRRVFDAAEVGGAILLFDEADALFGKRSEVQDSHDRYANIEVSYLLQRMEAYRGLAILTTNMKSALDPAFLRRIRFVVQFPFPDYEQRGEIWRRIFPSATPTEQLEYARLARLNVTGGVIHNIAMHAAFLAADNNTPVRMEHILQAARTEYMKLEKPLTEAEIKGWV